MSNAHPSSVQRKAIRKHLISYARLIQAEAEKMEVLGIQTTPSLFDKAQELMYLADLLERENVQVA